MLSLMQIVRRYYNDLFYCSISIEKPQKWVLKVSRVNLLVIKCK